MSQKEVFSAFEKLSTKRKMLQEEGVVPDWYTTQSFIMFERKYAYNGETVKGAFERIANTMCKHYTVDVELARKKFFDIMWKGYLAPSTPVMANSGTGRGMVVSCAGSYTEDSVAGFYDSYKETAILSQEGFGTSTYLGDIRPRGTKVSRGGTADGVVPVIDSFIDTTAKISQGNTRRGQCATYLPLDHEDFWEVSGYIQKNPASVNIGWMFSDEIIEELKNNDDEMVKRFNKVMYLRCRTGKGYFWKQDTANRLSPQPVKNSGIPIKASNLCVAPETQVLTDFGYVPIAELEGSEVNIWNGSEYSNVTVYKTGEDQKLLTVDTTSGYSLDCTPEHKFYIFTDYGKPYKEVRAKDLQVGDKLMKFDLPVIQGTKALEKAYVNGFYSGDGCGSGGYSRVYLYHEKRKLLPHFLKEEHTAHNVQEDYNREVLTMQGLRDKFFVPTSDYTIESRLDWLSGYLDADGCIHRNGTNEAITASSVELNFLKEVQLMLQTLGVSSKITKFADAGMRPLPANDGTGELKEFYCKDSWRLLISSCDSYKLLDLGLKFNRLRIKKHLPQRDAKQFVKVASVIDHGRVDDTYCFTEPKRHLGMFNGILTGQCNEISLPQDAENTFTCVLSSLNLSKWEEFEEDTIYWAVAFLDCVVSEMLTQAEGKVGLEKAVNFTKKSRALGLGTLGFHTFLQNKMLAFESLHAHIWNNKIFSELQKQSVAASKKLGTLFGEPEWCKGTGQRNATLNAIAPNMSSANLAGGVSQGIEPLVSNCYNQQSAAGELTRMNPSLIKIMRERGVYDLSVMDDLSINYNGSVQHVDWLTEDEKKVFKTAYEIDQNIILRMASMRQRFIDQGQSLNLFFSADEDEEIIADIHKDALLDEYIKGLYYLRSERGVKASTGECTACEG